MNNTAPDAGLPQIPGEDAFPDTLTERRQWLVWRFINKPGQKKPSKIPYYATSGHPRGWPMGKPRDGKPTDDQPQAEQGHDLDRLHLVTYAEAIDFACRADYDGVGFAFLPGDGLIGIDLDATLDAERQRAISAACGTFTEHSPSGTGLHIIGYGNTETFKSNDVGIEVFCGRQFFTMTGRHVSASPFAINEIPADTIAKLRRTVEQAKEAARALKEASKPATPANVNAAPAVAPTADASRYCLHALESAVQRLRGAVEGGRNDLLNAEAFGLAQLIHTGGISEATIRAALTDAAASCGLPPGEAKATIASGLRAGQQQPRSIPARQHRAGQPQTLPVAEVQPFIDPETGEILGPANDNEAPPVPTMGKPIDVFGMRQPPELPLDMLPEAIRAYVSDQAALTGCDPAIIGIGAIVAAASCITDRLKVQPKARDITWHEHPRLWVAFVGDPSTKKSPAISKAVRHVKRINHRLADENASARADYKWQHDAWKEAKKADKSNPPPEPKAPPEQRLMVEDATVESLSDILKDNPRGVLTLKDELTGWFASMDAYKAGGKGASMDRAHWLETYNGGPRTVDRVTRGNIYIPNWSTCIIGGIQPDMMRSIAKSMGNDGLLQRFMVVVARPAEADEDRAPDMEAMTRYSELFDQLFALDGSENAALLDDGAQACRVRVSNYARRLISAFDSPHMKAWLGKWDGLFGRLAITYHVIECASEYKHPSSRRISTETAKMVERLMCGYLLHHAIHFYSEILDANDRQEHVRQLGRLILAKRIERLTKRDIMLYWKASARMEWWQVRAVVDVLCTMAWLEPDTEAIDTDGKPRAWFVNPEVHQMFEGHAERERDRRQAASETLREIWGAYQQ